MVVRSGVAAVRRAGRRRAVDPEAAGKPPVSYTDFWRGSSQRRLALRTGGDPDPSLLRLVYRMGDDGAHPLAPLFNALGYSLESIAVADGAVLLSSMFGVALGGWLASRRDRFGHW